jgi:pimeloyl-ACP methyl ester carboxylesterase
VTETVAIAANGFAFTVDVAGPPDGDVVLLLHGFPQTRHAWRAELHALAAAGYRACAPDQRGYSAGARPAGVEAYRVEHLVGDALAIADTLGAQRFHLVGHDWGGQLAWIAAAQSPQRVRTLAVISRPHPAAFARALSEDPEQAKRSQHHRTHQRAEATDDLLAGGCKRLRAALSRQGVPEADVAAYLEILGERPALDAAVNWYRAAGSSGIAAANVPAVRVPTLYVWGNADATVGRPAAEGTAKFVDARYRFVELPGIGHFVTDQKPDAFPPLLLAHLRSESAST